MNAKNPTAAAKPAPAAKATEPTAPAKTGPNVELFVATARILLAAHIGHTDNNPWHLSRGNNPHWSVTLVECVPTAADGGQLYTGPVRGTDTETETGYARIEYSKFTKAEVRGWYAAMPRREAHTRHEEGRKMIGLPEGHPVLWWSPTRNELTAIIESGDPIGTAVKLATNQPTESNGGMNARTRRGIVAGLAKITKLIRDGKNPRGPVITIVDEYGAGDVMTVMNELNDKTEDEATKTRYAAIAELISKL